MSMGLLSNKSFLKEQKRFKKKDKKDTCSTFACVYSIYPYIIQFSNFKIQKKMFIVRKGKI